MADLKSEEAELQKTLADLQQTLAEKEKERQEKAALEKATELLKETPAYKAAVTAAEQEAMAECKETCVGREAHAECKACLADVTVPGYCAGHPGTEGC